MVFDSYILNRGWIDRTTKRLPTYKEITGSKANGKEQAGFADEGASSEDEAGVSKYEASIGNNSDDDEFEEVADRFESSYNFRFEET